ncbi:uncharacterized protein LOC131954597 [Physella acuta]|uniref:uncharacterized protein LOC131954597 n=1 Tax=Physella acuta TaxID=109671 RepID=UPI0027DAD0C6|nr:uncharacterized protein LOC131954597 [Physella acuta]
MIPHFIAVLFLLVEAFYSGAQAKITSFRVNGEVYSHILPVYVTQGADVIFNCDVDNITSTSHIVIIDDAGQQVASTNQSRTLAHVMYNVTCDVISGYICPIKFCHNSPRNATWIGKLGATATISLCAIADVKTHAGLSLWINGERIRTVTSHSKYQFTFSMIGQSTMHYNVSMAMKINKPEDFGHYFVEDREYGVDVLTFSVDLHGEGEKCPKDWCELEARCVHLEDPTDNVTLAAGVCESYGGHVMRETPTTGAAQCMSDHNANRIWIINNTVCDVWNEQTKSIESTRNCSDDSSLTLPYFCQLPFWAPWKREITLHDPNNSTMYWIVAGGVAVVIALVIAGFLIFRVLRIKTKRLALPDAAPGQFTTSSADHDRYTLIDTYDMPDGERHMPVIRQRDGYYTFDECYDVTDGQDTPPVIPPMLTRMPQRHVYDVPAPSD